MQLVAHQEHFVLLQLLMKHDAHLLNHLQSKQQFNNILNILLFSQLYSKHKNIHFLNKIITSI